MRVALTSNGKEVVISPDKPSEYAFLKEFIGGRMVASSQSVTLSSEPRIAQTVLSRLKEDVDGKFVIGITPDIKRIMEWRPKLLPLPEWFRYHSEPLEHQDIALRYLWTFKRHGLGLDPGLGKTKIVLDWIWACKGKALVVCPKPLLFVWLKEAARHRPELKIHVMESVTYMQRILARQEKIDKMDPVVDSHAIQKIRKEIAAIKVDRAAEVVGLEKADVVVVNYAKVVQNRQFFLSRQWDLLAVDEALVKNPSSEQTEALTDICRQVPNFTLMSGTLVNNHAGDAYSPTHMLHRDLLGRSFYKFDAKYAIKREIEVGVEGGGEEDKKKIKMTIGYRNEHQIKAALASVFLFMRKEQWLKNLPAKTFHQVHVRLSDEQKNAYRELKANYSLQLPSGDLIEVENALSCAAKLTQISSGFVYYGLGADDFLDIGMKSLSEVIHNGKKKPKKKKVTGPRETFRFSSQPKIAATRDLLVETLSREKVVLWYNYGAEGEMLAEMMREEGITFRIVNGASTKTGENIEAFNTLDSVRVLLCQAKAVNYGVTLLGRNLEECEYEPELNPEVCTHIYYSLNYSLEVFLQQQDRSHRIGMRKAPHYYILKADTPIEHAIAQKLLMKQEVRESFLEDTLRPPTLSQVDGLGD